MDRQPRAAATKFCPDLLVIRSESCELESGLLGRVDEGIVETGDGYGRMGVRFPTDISWTDSSTRRKREAGRIQ